MYTLEDPGEMHIRFVVPLCGKSDLPVPTRFPKKKINYLSATCVPRHNLLQKTTDTNIEAVYLDFAKTFDKIDHSILINKLKHIGVGGKLLSIIEDYLSNRKQYVEVNGTASDLLLVLSGVPQFSLLGPLLFLLYIYDMPQNLNCDIFSFADDSKLLSIHKLYEASNLQENLDIIHQWCSKHKMQFNVSKCAHMCFTGSPCQNLTLADEPVPFSLSTKDLGLQVTADLKWNVHIQETTCKAFSALFPKTERSRGTINQHETQIGEIDDSAHPPIW